MIKYKRIIIKIGSNVLAKSDGLIDEQRIAHLTDQITQLKNSGVEVILVSSGAVASGRGLIRVSDRCDAVAARQLLASVGQVKLINIYADLFAKSAQLCSQVLVTKDDFRDRIHYLNIKNCLEILLQHGVIPIVNENDVVSVTELMFTDNDELAGLIASMLNAQALVILTNVDGIYNGNPAHESSEVIKEINGKGVDLSAFVVQGKSQFGRGGMITKTHMAQKVAQLGITVHIANGTRENIVHDILSGDVPHTCFLPQKVTSGRKKWLAHSETAATGVVELNDGAKQALSSDKAISLLPVGIHAIKTDFRKGDIIKLVDSTGNIIGVGRAEYGADKARERMGQKNQKPLVHYDYLYLQ
ncbi:glutamate 5-kinase [Mucilaginibacter roseus]|uniref:Glutamate 5-kinase n=1 Tax=Mucilaginibacter roseus TaxID=1528868 RepID=A0ABS8TYB6_9SPHI|nr:glutamate 5-kinase [Mucilaginibacter roseus]MCD8739873.1 glutamate 5-kinase [Mucilaginibacter roseus]